MLSLDEKKKKRKEILIICNRCALVREENFMTLTNQVFAQLLLFLFVSRKFHRLSETKIELVDECAIAL